ncbi:MAG TPA: hypothetical protein VMW36_04910 [Patescibacteria group bacterium]|nr:hypothetical protein [Patescibacteria group bacterium]
MGKGSTRRPTQIGKEEELLRWKLAFGKISFAEFEERYNQLLREGKIVRSGRKVKHG